jgi:hypothetical protein
LPLRNASSARVSTGAAPGLICSQNSPLAASLARNAFHFSISTASGSGVSATSMNAAKPNAMTAAVTPVTRTTELRMPMDIAPTPVSARRTFGHG